MSLNSGRSAFLISKPLQLMMALCIVNQSNFDVSPVFIIINTFCGARKVSERLSCNFEQLQTPVFFDSRQAALLFIKEQKFDHLFIDSDVGVRNFLTLASFKLFNPKLSINVYEEGLGTYRTELYSGLKKNLLGFIGVGVFFGGCCFVTSVYVCHPNEYIKNIQSNKLKVREIQGGLSKFLLENLDTLKRIFDFNSINIKTKKTLHCSIYLSSWQIDSQFLTHFQKFNGDLFIKPHPHIRNYDEINIINTIGANVPAELVLSELMEIYNTVSVFDHNSSVRRYISGKNLFYQKAEIP